VLSLKRAAWSFRVLPGDTVVPSQHQMTNILNHLHAGLELRLSVTYFTYHFRPFPIVTILGEVGGVAEVYVSFESAH
jgi:hypothetical protein